MKKIYVSILLIPLFLITGCASNMEGGLDFLIDRDTGIAWMALGYKSPTSERTFGNRVVYTWEASFPDIRPQAVLVGFLGNGESIYEFEDRLMGYDTCLIEITTIDGRITDYVYSGNFIGCSKAGYYWSLKAYEKQMKEQKKRF